MNGRGAVEPNPMVGCVIVKGGRIIGEGYHERFGGPHAEPNALAACIESPAGATAYVTLEPCCHLNKKTPPCAPRLIEAKIARVVVGCLDPNAEVNGKGLAMLRAAGIEVVAPVLETEAKQLVAPFLARVRHGRTYVTLKWAESADGKVAGPGGRRAQISNERSMHLVHELRARSDAILIGIKTLLVDDPLLTARGVELRRPLIRAVIDPDLKTPLTSRLVRSAPQGKVILYCGDDRAYAGPNRVDELRGVGVQVKVIPAVGGRLLLSEVAGDLAKRGATHVLVDAGPSLARGFFAAQLVDRLWIFRSPRPIDGDTAPAAAPVPDNFAKTGEMDVQGDRLTEYLNRKSDVFFAPVPSADFATVQQ